MNHLCNLSELLPKLNAARRRNGKAGSIGKTTPTAPIPSPINPTSFSYILSFSISHDIFTYVHFCLYHRNVSFFLVSVFTLLHTYTGQGAIYLSLISTVFSFYFCVFLTYSRFSFCYFLNIIYNFFSPYFPFLLTILRLYCMILIEKMYDFC